MQRVRLGDVRRIFAAQFCRLVFANSIIILFLLVPEGDGRMTELVSSN